jgi:hypothetical protein
VTLGAALVASIGLLAGAVVAGRAGPAMPAVGGAPPA